MQDSDRTVKLEELIKKFGNLRRDLIPTEEKLNAELSKVKQHILDRARARTSFTGDPFKDLSIVKFGKKFKENYEQLLKLKDMLEDAKGTFILIHDMSYNLLINILKEADRCYIPFRVAALGIIDSNPLEVGYEHDIRGDHYYLKLRFQNGAYIRELEGKDEGKLDKWLKVIPTFRGRGEGYTEKSEPLKLVMPITDIKSSEVYHRLRYPDEEAYIRQAYTDDKAAIKSKKPYWRIAPDRFDTSKVKIVSGPVVEIFERQEFPEKEHKTFALYIGNEEVTKRLHLNVEELSTLEKIYDTLNSTRGKPGGKTLIF
ncbi:MAG: hypothetical protein KAQ85_10115 [Thermodesulfovibrionia bacterium]|nr:hypothetical protein [Thermodesulfovibrionia bacterium]